MTAESSHPCGLQSRRSAAYHHHVARALRTHKLLELIFPAGNGIGRTGDRFAARDPTPALVAGDAPANTVGFVSTGLVWPLRIDEQSAAHSDHVRLTGGEDVFGLLRPLNSGARDDPNVGDGRFDARLDVLKCENGPVAVGQMCFDCVEIALTEREIVKVTVGGQRLRDLDRLVDGQSTL